MRTGIDVRINEQVLERMAADYRKKLEAERESEPPPLP
jgi:hypothetical protein